VAPKPAWGGAAFQKPPPLQKTSDDTPKFAGSAWADECDDDDPAPLRQPPPRPERMGMGPPSGFGSGGYGGGGYGEGGYSGSSYDRGSLSGRYMGSSFRDDSRILNRPGVLAPHMTLSLGEMITVTKDRRAKHDNKSTPASATTPATADAAPLSRAGASYDEDRRERSISLGAPNSDETDDRKFLEGLATHLEILRRPAQLSVQGPVQEPRSEDTNPTVKSQTAAATPALEGDGSHDSGLIAPGDAAANAAAMRQRAAERAAERDLERERERERETGAEMDEQIRRRHSGPADGRVQADGRPPAQWERDMEARRQRGEHVGLPGYGLPFQNTQDSMRMYNQSFEEPSAFAAWGELRRERLHERTAQEPARQQPTQIMKRPEGHPQPQERARVRPEGLSKLAEHISNQPPPPSVKEPQAQPLRRPEQRPAAMASGTVPTASDLTRQEERRRYQEEAIAKLKAQAAAAEAARAHVSARSAPSTVASRPVMAPFPSAAAPTAGPTGPTASTDVEPGAPAMQTKSPGASPVKILQKPTSRDSPTAAATFDKATASPEKAPIPAKVAKNSGLKLQQHQGKNAHPVSVPSSGKQRDAKTALDFQPAKSQSSPLLQTAPFKPSAPPGVAATVTGEGSGRKSRTQRDRGQDDAGQPAVEQLSPAPAVVSGSGPNESSLIENSDAGTSMKQKIKARKAKVLDNKKQVEKAPQAEALEEKKVKGAKPGKSGNSGQGAQGHQGVQGGLDARDDESASQISKMAKEVVEGKAGQDGNHGKEGKNRKSSKESKASKDSKGGKEADRKMLESCAPEPVVLEMKESTPGKKQRGDKTPIEIRSQTVETDTSRPPASPDSGVKESAATSDEKRRSSAQSSAQGKGDVKVRLGGGVYVHPRARQNLSAKQPVNGSAEATPSLKAGVPNDSPATTKIATAVSAAVPKSASGVDAAPSQTKGGTGKAKGSRGKKPAGPSEAAAATEASPDKSQAGDEGSTAAGGQNAKGAHGAKPAHGGNNAAGVQVKTGDGTGMGGRRGKGGDRVATVSPEGEHPAAGQGVSKTLEVAEAPAGGEAEAAGAGDDNRRRKRGGNRAGKRKSEGAGENRGVEIPSSS